jgi:hypothetical protein
MNGKKNFDNLRDCVKQALLKGCERGLEFNKMRHAIILELKRIGYNSSEIKDKLIEWNRKCERPFSLSEQKIQLLGYVDWVDKHQCKIGCKGLEDYCLGKDKCQFYLKTSYQNRQKTQQLPFKLEELDKFLTERYKAEGYPMLLIIKALRFYQQEKATGEIILIGYRALSSIIRDRYGHNLLPMDIFRKMNFLIQEGVIERVVKGNAGMFNKKANGYRFLKWIPHI